jgi:hypothetical protein
MNERVAIITWSGIVGVVAIIMGCATLMSIYSPPKPRETARQTCATYESVRNTAFCVEIARNGHDD